MCAAITSPINIRCCRRSAVRGRNKNCICFSTYHNEHLDGAQKGTGAANDGGQDECARYTELHHLLDVDVMRRALLKFVEQLIDAGKCGQAAN